MEPCGEPAQPCRVLDITATTRTAPYASGILWIDGDGLLRKAVYALASGKLAKEITYRYRDNLGQLEPSGMTLVDLLMPSGNAKTVLEIVSRRLAQHPAAMFDPQQQIKR
jgi:Outer membrane lipoprotein-sorting protein